MEITSIPIVDFYKYCLKSAQNRGYNWVVTLVARDADSMDLYHNLMRSWRSINSITAGHILFVFAGKGNHAVRDDASCISDNEYSWRRIRNQFITFLNPHADLQTVLPNPDSYAPYDWHADKYGYLEHIRENHTDAIGPLKEYFNLCEADIPCLVFTSLRANRQHIVPVSNSANDLYHFFKKLITTIEPFLMRLRSLDSDYKSTELSEISQKLPDIKHQIDTTISQIDALIADSVMTECIHRSSLQSRVPMGRNELLGVISSYLTFLSNRLELLNRNGLTDLNHSLEQTYCGLLNLVFDWNLQNMNGIRMNFPGIDLATEDGKICVQISSDASPEKIRKTLSVFFKGENVEKCGELYIFFTKAYNHKVKKFDEYHPDDFVFDFNSHVWDTNKLFSRISTLDTEKLKAITEHLSNECGFLPA